MTTVQLPEKIKEASAGAQTCRHHWVIDAPGGPVSRGECRTCGEARDFKNTIDSASGVKSNALQTLTSGLG